MELELNEAQVEQLRARAKSLGIAPEELARAAIADLLASSDEDFEQAVEHILTKNRELYERLA